MSRHICSEPSGRPAKALRRGEAVHRLGPALMGLWLRAGFGLLFLRLLGPGNARSVDIILHALSAAALCDSGRRTFAAGILSLSREGRLAVFNGCAEALRFELLRVGELV